MRILITTYITKIIIPTFILICILIVSECDWLEIIKRRYNYHVEELDTNHKKSFREKKIKLRIEKKRYAN